MTIKLEIPSVLAFERKLDPSDALFYCGSWDDQANSEDWPSIAIHEKSVRGVISNRPKTKDQDPAKIDADIKSPNLQSVDVAILPHKYDTLKTCFTLRILGGIGNPSVCNNSQYQEKLSDIIDKYIQSHGISELARRYAYNLASGRFLWRNRICSEQVAVNIELLENGNQKQLWEFNDSLTFSLNDSNFVVSQEAKAQLMELAKIIAAGLTGNSYTLLKITAFSRMGAGQEVFPSQELILERVRRGGKSRTLYKVGETAAIHSQKIGNAIRTIDTWYSDEEPIEPISVEPYGSVTNRGKAFRQPKQKLDFYTLLDKWIIENIAPDLEQQHFVIAMLIRGGVFGKAEDKTG
jgi:CRISPR-associated protein Csy3